MPEPVFVVGDVHGHRDALVRLLRGEGLVDRRERWTGGDARLWLLGDLADRGPDGIGAIELVMALEERSRGRVACLLGNHDLLLVAVARVPDVPVWPGGTTFRRVWLSNGGLESDLAALRAHHVAWLTERPAVALEGDTLLLHADTDQYLRFGSSVGEVIRRMRAVLADGDAHALGGLMDVLSDRYGLADPNRVSTVLAVLGGTRIVHGHTPIAFVTAGDPGQVTEPLVSPDGRVVNADHCLFGGGPGFVVRL